METLKKIKSKYLRLKTRIPIIFIISLLIMSTAIISISFKRYEDLNLKKHIKMAAGMTSLMADAYDTSKTDYYIAENYNSDEYKDLLKYYYKLKNSFLNVTYVYVYRLYQDDDGVIKGEVVMDLDDVYTDDVPQSSIDWIGDDYIIDDVFADDYENMVINKVPVWHIVVPSAKDNTAGKLLSYIYPIVDKNGNYVASACVDFSWSNIYGSGIDFIWDLLMTISIVLIVVLATVNILLRRIMFSPLEKMTNTIKHFKYNSDEDRLINVRHLESLDIHVNNEIDDLYNALVVTTKDSAYYLSNFNKAQMEIREINEIVSKDVLTGVKSKSAYDAYVAKLDADINQNKYHFAVVMVDINNLKYVNDKYGHELGNAYIRGCIKHVCDINKKSPVFRIGGDEFVVILEGTEYEDRQDLMDDMEEFFADCYNDSSKQEYERYSVSIGMAEFDKKHDTSYAEVFNKADKAMYENKMKFKKQYGSYR